MTMVLKKDPGSWSTCIAFNLGVPIMTNTHAHSLTTLRCWSDWLGQVAGKLHVTGTIFKKYNKIHLVGSFLEVILNVINLPGSTWLMFTGRNSVFLTGHLPRETLTLLSWVFILLAVLSAPLMDHTSTVAWHMAGWNPTSGIKASSGTI